jgi:hypothetical protein
MTEGPRAALQPALRYTFGLTKAMRHLLILTALCTAVTAASQSTLPTGATMKVTPGKESKAAALDTPGTPGSVTIIEAAGVKELMAEHAKREHVLKGYRLQIFLNADRKQAETLRAQFLQKHPDVPAYLSYQAPNFKVRVGDLLTRLEGEKLRAELKAEFPGCYIVPDEIEPPVLTEE